MGLLKIKNLHAADASKTIFYFVLFVPKLCIVR